MTNEDGISVLHLLETATGKEKPLPKLPVGLILGITWHRNNQDLGFTLVSARTTADVYSLNILTNKIERWTITVYDVLGWLAAGMSHDEILEDFPELTAIRHKGLFRICC